MIRRQLATSMQPESTLWRGVHSREFRTWVRTCATGPRDLLSPAEELLAEHHLAGGVILAMEEGANQLAEGSHMPGFWNNVVEFIGNFIHLVHRSKETHCFAAAVDAGTLAQKDSATLEREHEGAKQTTLALIAAIERGDWEGTYDHVAYYSHVMRPHMAHEERTLIPGLRNIPREVQTSLRTAFNDVEASKMRPRNRKYYLDLVRRTCGQIGVEHPL